MNSDNDAEIVNGTMKVRIKLRVFIDGYERQREDNCGIHQTH